MQAIGKSVRRIDAVAKVRGQAKYVDDLITKDVLVAKVFRSTIANGWVKRIDTSKAVALPGVEAVVTYEDVPKHTFPTAGHPYSKDPEHQDVADRNLLTRRVRFYGDEIAAVVAVDEFTAEQALKLIEVEYEEYEPILTAEDALKEGAVEIHQGTKNIIDHTGYELGDVAAAFAGADYIFEDEFKTSTVQHCQLENHICYAYVESDGRIVIITSTQIPHIVKRIAGQALGVPWGKIRVIKPCVGGGFGSRQDVVQEPLTAFLSLAVHGRPVKLEYSREECMIASRVRHAINFKIKTGVKKDGTIVARELQAISLNGGYASHGHAVVSNAGSKFNYLYPYNATKFDATTVYTTAPVAGAMRGYGIPQVIFALESHMDDIARSLGLDPIEFRLKNLVQQGYVDPLTGIRVDSCGIRECIARGKELIGWDEEKAQGKGDTATAERELPQLKKEQTGTRRRGLGMACFSYTSGIHPEGLEIAGARIVLNQDGSVQLQIGATEIGQGSDTVLAQMTAETIGIPVEIVHVLSTQDTDLTPFDTGAYASRQTYISGMAVVKAAEEIKAKVLNYASGMTGIPAGSMDIVNAWLVYKHNGERIISLADVALDSYYNRVSASPITADVSNNARINALSFGCTFAEVEVDLATCKVEVLKIYSVHDAGKIINPQLAEAQVHGGVSMGLGYALSEQLLFDPKTGKPLNNNLLDYKLPTIMDIPEIGASFVETYEPSGPYGSKSLGETPTIPTSPAIRNAILDATGIKFNELPINPHLMFKKFKEAGLL
ncbi:MAG TPA: xanthine dehydrogenase molybdenum-binding subunit XdhA [Bacillota bacterium]|nr:xanthine dehydrogenase molybdenum-binding subunit XdhA [Bacillota bacterium]